MQKPNPRIVLFLVFKFLQCDYCNRGHLDKADQSQYRKIHSRKIGCGSITAGKKKNNKLLEAQNLNIDSKCFSRKQNFFSNAYIFPLRQHSNEPLRKHTLSSVGSKGDICRL